MQAVQFAENSRNRTAGKNARQNGRIRKIFHLPDLSHRHWSRAIESFFRLAILAAYLEGAPEFM